MEAIIGGIVGFVVGAVASNVATGVISGTGTVIRGLTKEVIKGGLMIQENVSGMCSGGGNFFSDLVTEARSELASSSGGGSVPAGGRAAK